MAKSCWCIFQAEIQTLTSSITVTKRMSRRGNIANSFIVQYRYWRWWCWVFPVYLDAALYCSRKPTANQPHCDHGNVSDTSWYSRGFLGNVVFGIPKRLIVSTGRTLIMAIYYFTTVTGVVVFCQPDCGDSTELLGRKLSWDSHLDEKEIKR